MNQLKKLMLLIACATVSFFVTVPTSSQAHCQIPCGIYDDYARVLSMLEDVTTVEKSTKLINELAANKDPQSQNQVVRWVMNKEKHSQNIISTISDYFLTQRVKTSQDDYLERLAKHHAVIVAAMKVKQNADPKFTKTLRANVEALRPYYPEHKH